VLSIPLWRASWKPAASVIVTSVGMIRSIRGISRFVSSTRAGTGSDRMIGPITKPMNRSSAVHIPPPTTWKKSSPQVQSLAIVATSPTRIAATGIRPRRGISGCAEAGASSSRAAATAISGL
jgi:hypothetical protein